jgi:hypothetical protein
MEKNEMQMKNKKSFRENRQKKVTARTTDKELKSDIICFNVSCKLRRAGCKGFEGCPGYMAK